MLLKNLLANLRLPFLEQLNLTWQRTFIPAQSCSRHCRNEMWSKEALKAACVQCSIPWWNAWILSYELAIERIHVVICKILLKNWQEWNKYSLKKTRERSNLRCENSGCGLSASVAYPSAFTVVRYMHATKAVTKNNHLLRFPFKPKVFSTILTAS